MDKFFSLLMGIALSGSALGVCDIEWRSVCEVNNSGGKIDIPRCVADYSVSVQSLDEAGWIEYANKWKGPGLEDLRARFYKWAMCMATESKARSSKNERRNESSLSSSRPHGDPEIEEQPGYSELRSTRAPRYSDNQAYRMAPKTVDKNTLDELLKDRKRTEVLDTQNLSICLRVEYKNSVPEATNDCNKTIDYEYCWTKTIGDKTVSCEDNKYAGWVLKPYASSTMIQPKMGQGSKIYWAACAYPGIVSDKRWSPKGISFSCR